MCSGVVLIREKTLSSSVRSVISIVPVNRAEPELGIDPLVVYLISTLLSGCVIERLNELSCIPGLRENVNFCPKDAVTAIDININAKKIIRDVMAAAP